MHETRRAAGHDGLVIFALGLGDRALDGERVIDLPHRLGMALLQNVLEDVADGRDRRLVRRCRFGFIVLAL